MGAEVDSNMYFPGYCAIRNENGNAGNVASRHGNHFDRFLTGPSAFKDDSWYAKEQLKQTILKHECTFKHQLQELHRIYIRQRDLMNDIKGKGLYEHRVQEKASHSSLFASRTICEDAHVQWHASDICLVDSSSGRASTSVSDVIRSPHSLTEKKKTMQPGPVDGIRPEKHEVLELNSKKLQRRLFDLELPADNYMNDDEKRGKSYPFDINNEPILIGEPESSTRKHNLVDLNESVQVEEAFVPASMNNVGNIICSNEETRAWNSCTSSNSGFHSSSKEFSRRRRDEGAFPDYPHLQNGRKDKGIPFYLDAEQTRGSRELCIASEPLQFALHPLDPCKTQPQSKRTIFGVELPARGDDLPVVGSDMSSLDLHHLSSSRSSVFSSWHNLPCNSGQNLVQFMPPNATSHLADLNKHLGPSVSFRNDLFSYQHLASANGKQPREIRKVHFPSHYRMELCSSQNNSQFVAGKTEVGKNVAGNSIQDEKTSSCVSQSIGMILGVPIFDKPQVNPLPKTSSLSDDNSSAKVGLVNNDSMHDLSESGGQEIFEGLASKKGLDSCNNGIRHHIDLNLCFIEEEVPITPSNPSAAVRSAAEIDLEAPAVLETENCHDREVDSSESHEGVIKSAAEALVSLSSVCVHDPIDNAPLPPSEAPTSDSLHWFADVVSSLNHDPENEARTNSKDSPSQEEHIPDELDYFEFMTLELTETKLEECSYRPSESLDQKDEDTLPKRPRRGQARRGRPRKDFIRDILPGISSLSRHEVTEDLQTFEAIVRASGGTWESSSAKKKNGSGRGRKRKCTTTPAPTPNISAVSSPPMQQINYTQTVLEEGRLMGWGKRTRRPPRQRCPIVDPPLLVK